MSARERLNRARLLLAASAVGSALIWGLAIGVGLYVTLLAVAAVAGRWLGNGISLGIAMVAGVACFSTLIWRSRFVFARTRVALWLEEHVPELRYALVSLEEPTSLEATPALERVVASTRWAPPLRRAALGALATPFALLILSVVILLAIPAGSESKNLAAARTRGASREPSGGSREARSRLTPLSVSVAPPGYTRLPVRELRDPGSVTALAGSRLSVSGPGEAATLSAEMGESSLRVTTQGSAWQTSFAMPAKPTALRLSSEGAERLLILEAQLDSVPVVVLSSPPRDTIFRSPRASVTLKSAAHDDYGLAELRLEYIISSGQGESFSFRSGVLTRSNPRSKNGELSAVVRLDSLGLEPGDMVHLRAVAVDRNDITGPGTGYSETRRIRIARPDEYDSLAVEAAAPLTGDTSLVSQRMLIIRAETLQSRRPRLARDSVVAESERIGSDQERLRRQIGDIIFMRAGGEPTGAEHAHDAADQTALPDRKLTPDEIVRAAQEATDLREAEALDFHGGEAPVVAINKTLLEAYNAMWDAGRELGIGEPDDALPHMRRALALIQQARQAERIYLRGRPPAVIVDLAKVRLAGKREDLAVAARSPRAGPPAASVERARRFAAALAILEREPAAAIDSLALLRLDAISQAPGFASALGDALAALNSGSDATAALVRARRLLAGEPLADSTLSLWSSP